VTKNDYALGLIILLSAICLASVASAQASWWRTYGGTNQDWGNSVQQTSAGGYIIAGYTTSFGAGGLDVYLVNTDSLGDTLWTKTYGGWDSDGGNSTQQTTWTAPDLLDTFLGGKCWFLVLSRAEVVEARVPPPSIIEQLDILDNRGFGFSSAPKPPQVD